MMSKSPPQSSAPRGSRRRAALIITIPSLMQPADKPLSRPGAAHWENDLGLGELVQALSVDPRYTQFIRQALLGLSTDPDVIAWRQAVLADLLRNPGLVEQVQALLPQLANLRRGRAMLGNKRRSLLLETSDRLAELDMYVSAVQELSSALDSSTLQSPALTALRSSLQALMQDESFGALRQELPELRAPLQHIASLTIGVNLDSELRPISALLLAINDRPFAETASFLDRLLGARTNPDDETGIAPLHRVPEERELRPLSPLFQDLDKLVAQTAQPVARSLGRYVHISGAPLAALEYELAFYVAAVGLINRLSQMGVLFCQPEIAPLDERVTEIHGLVNLNLALRLAAQPVPSDAAFGPEGRIAILTGPNSGGKTVYVQAVGLAHVLFQGGLFIPAQSARISPADSILTHFPALETRQQGRLAEEAGRLREIFKQANAHSLVLLNESLSSTAFGEALYLAQDIVGALRAIGLRAIYATHLVELAERIPEIEALVPGESRVFSLVAGIKVAENGRPAPTFQIARGMPLGRSYAQEIAHQHGISLEQILEARKNNKP